MAGNFKPQPREKTVLDNPKLKLSAEKLPNGEQRPSFSLYWTNNNPRIDVWTGVTSEKDGGLIRAKLDDVWLGTLLTSLESLCKPDAPNDVAYIIECKDHTWHQNKRSQEPVVTARIVAGRDKDGRTYVSVLSADPQRSKVRFLFGNTWYNSLSHKNEKLSDAQISWIVCQSWINMVRNFYTAVASANYSHVTKNANGNGGGNNKANQYGNRGGNNNSGSSNGSEDDYADDLPF